MRLMAINTNPIASKPRRGRTSSQTSGKTARSFGRVVPARTDLEGWAMCLHWITRSPILLQFVQPQGHSLRRRDGWQSRSKRSLNDEQDSASGKAHAAAAGVLVAVEDDRSHRRGYVSFQPSPLHDVSVGSLEP